jgi:ketosteroid isomerase-like protein
MEGGVSSNRDIVQAAYAAFAAGDLGGLRSTLAVDVVWTEAESFPYAGTYRGPDRVMDELIVRLVTEWEGFRVMPEEYIDGGDRIVALGTYEGTYKATGKSFRSRFAHVWTLRDGKVSRFTQYADTAEIQAALRRTPDWVH